MCVVKRWSLERKIGLLSIISLKSGNIHWHINVDDYEQVVTMMSTMMVIHIMANVTPAALPIGAITTTKIRKRCEGKQDTYLVRDVSAVGNLLLLPAILGHLVRVDDVLRLLRHHHRPGHLHPAFARRVVGPALLSLGGHVLWAERRKG